MKRAVFLDRDGVINAMVYNTDFGLVDSPANPAEFLAVEINNWPYPYSSGTKNYYITEGCSDRWACQGAGLLAPAVAQACRRWSNQTARGEFDGHSCQSSAAPR